MKIVQLVFTLGPGGAEKFVVNLSNQLAEEGHEVIVLQIRNDEDSFDIHFNKRFLSDKVKYINLGLSRGFKYRKALKVMYAIRKLKPDVVHSHLNVLPYIYPMTLLLGKPKFIHTIHNVADKECRVRWQKKVNRFLYKHKNIIPVTISEECRKSFEHFYGINHPAMIDNGCPPIRPTSEYENVVREIKSLKSNSESKMFIHVARYIGQKNQNLLIDAFNRIVEDGANVDLIILGIGFDSDDGLKLQEKACGRIHFLGTRPNVGDYLLNSDYFILSSLWEGLPISLIEAMSAKVIPVCTPAGGIPNVIKDGVSGFLSKDFELGNFVKTIKRALSTSISQDEIYSTYLSSFSMKKCTDDYINVYKS